MVKPCHIRANSFNEEVKLPSTKEKLKNLNLSYIDEGVEDIQKKEADFT